MLTNLESMVICLEDDNWKFKSACLEELEYIVNLLHKTPGMKGHLDEWIDINNLSITYSDLTQLIYNEYIVQKKIC